MAQPALQHDATTYAGPWTVKRSPDGWVVCRDGLTMSMWRATREAAQVLADDENLRWRQRQVEIAAPDLLRELKHCVWLLQDIQPEPGLVQQQALAAIAKAEPSR